MKGWATEGMDTVLSTVQMPSGIPVGTLAIGKAGAINAALLATAAVLALGDPGCNPGAVPGLPSGPDGKGLG